MDIEKIIAQINSMSKEEFYLKIIRGIAKSAEFSKLVTFGADDLSEEEKKYLCGMLEKAGVCMGSGTLNDDNISKIANTITTRAVRVI